MTVDRKGAEDGGVRSKLMRMAAESVKAEVREKFGPKLDTLLERQDWMDQLKKVSYMD